MKTFYSPSTGRFYQLDMDSAELPDDCIEVDQTESVVTDVSLTTRYSASTGCFYPLGIDYPNLPVDCIEVAHSDFEAAMARPPGSKFAFVNGQLAITVAVGPTFDQVKAAKLIELATAFTSAMASIRAGYPADEIQSWDEQKAEAAAHASDSAAATPLLSAMAAARGITLADLVSRVLANAAAWSTASGALIGKRQAYEDQVDAANDAADIALIVWTD